MGNTLFEHPEPNASDKTAHVFDVGRQFGLEFEDHQQFEFFFYSESEDDAANLAIELFKLDYEVEPVTKSTNQQWLVNGWTHQMDSDLDSVSGWSEEMEALANQHNCRFDGWGSFCK